MAKHESTVFKVGDVVSLKVQPEFRGVIENFWEKTSVEISKAQPYLKPAMMLWNRKTFGSTFYNWMKNM